MPSKIFLLVDSNSLANRAFYALPSLSNTKNVPTNAVYGFLTMLFRFLEERKPEYIACAFDHPSPTFRHAAFKEYKAKRKPAPESFKEQVPLLKEVLSVLNIPAIEVPGFEADDIIGTLSQKALLSGRDVIILSGDRDCFQLVRDGVEAVLPIRGISHVAVYDSQKVKEDFGVWPHQVVDFKALSGDSSDNIPGVKGIGEKTAIDLLSKYDNLDKVYEHIEEIEPEKVRKLLLNGKDAAFLSRELATIRKDVPLTGDIESFRWSGPCLEKTLKLFTELEFKTLLSKVSALSQSYGPETVSSGSEVSTGIQNLSLQDEGEFPSPLILDSEEKVEELCSRVSRAGEMAIYAKSSEVTRGFEWPEDIGISCDGKTYVLSEKAMLAGASFREPGAYQRILREHLVPVLADPGVKKVGFDLKWAETLCLKEGFRFQGELFDILIGAYLIDPTRTQYDLRDISRKYGFPDIPPYPDHTRPGDPGLNGDDGFQNAVANHLSASVFLIPRLAASMKDELSSLGLWDLASQVEFPLIEVLSSMEVSGIGVDLKKARELREMFSAELSRIEEEIFQMAGERFNLGSPKQLAYILFDKLGLKPVKKTKTGYSTDAEVLDILAEEHPLPEKILEYRQYAKLKSTYLDVLDDVVNPVTGRIHSTFHQTVTATGRLSSSEPNLQNIPVRGELGRSIRRIFVPSPGKLFLASDYSQIELRIMAHMSGDPSLIEAFLKGEDIHRRTASEIFGVPLDQVTDELRARAKAVNFGVIYGISDYGLARQTGVPREEARSFIENYFKRYPGVKAYMDSMIEKARKDKYVTTILGRRRPIPDIDARVKSKRGFAERTAINTPIQGSAADIIKLAMVKIYRRMVDLGLESRMILQVHDELIFEILPSEEEIMRRLVQEEMEGAIRLKVPLKVEMDVGPSWYDV